MVSIKIDDREVMTFAEKFVHHKNLLVCGQIATGTVESLIYKGVAGSIFFKLFFDIPNWLIFYIVLGCAILTGILQYLYGYFYERKRLFEVENTWLTDRTPIFQELMKKGIGEEK